jgi:hypothetical protein
MGCVCSKKEGLEELKVIDIPNEGSEYRKASENSKKEILSQHALECEDPIDQLNRTNIETYTCRNKKSKIL